MEFFSPNLKILKILKNGTGYWQKPVADSAKRVEIHI